MPFQPHQQAVGLGVRMRCWPLLQPTKFSGLTCLHGWVLELEMPCQRQQTQRWNPFLLVHDKRFVGLFAKCRVGSIRRPLVGLSDVVDVRVLPRDAVGENGKIFFLDVENAFAWCPISTCSSCFLNVCFHLGRRSRVKHPTDLGRIDSHAKGAGARQDLQCSIHPHALTSLFIACGESGMV